MKPRSSNISFGTELINCESWSDIDPSALSEKKRALFLKRKDAVKMCIEGIPRAKISERFGISRRELARLQKRCFSPHPDGRIWGFRALKPGTHMKRYELNPPAIKCLPEPPRTGFAGALKELFRQHPSIEEDLLDLLLKRTSGAVYEPRIPLQNLHNRFIKLCRQANIPERDYPFCVRFQGRRSLEKHLRHILHLHFSEGARARLGKENARLLESGSYGGPKVPALRPYQAVYLDPHRVDAFFSVQKTDAFGAATTHILRRIWIIVIQDAASKAILGYYLSLNQEVSALEVLRTIRSAVEPWKPLPLTIPNLIYPEKGGFPSAVIPECQWACFDEVLYDNALANLAIVVREQLVGSICLSVNAGPVRTPRRRALLEGFYHLLEENCYHRLPSTTGGSPVDSRRNEPEKSAKRYEITYEHLQELTEVYLANFNATPMEGLFYASPLEYIRRYISNKGLIRTIPEKSRASFKCLIMKVTRKVRGNEKKGRRPFINLEGAQYTSPSFGKMPGLIGKTVIVHMDVDDLRSVKVWHENGDEIGILRANNRWAVTRHSIETRRAINRLRHRRILHLLESQDAIQCYMEYLNKLAKRSKGAANQLEKTIKGAKEDEETRRGNRGECDESNPSDTLPPPPQVAINRKALIL